jgi:cellulose synthase/poly-beta-1,6-N-acetylglucosamine synthase-like glycosyltransferase
MQTAFWIFAALILYVYAGYPLLLALKKVLTGGRAMVRRDCEPTVTVVISAYNERAVIADKLRNTLGLDYPRARLQVLVVSDASDDGTDAAVLEFGSQSVELLRMPQRGGKTLGLNAAVERARGEIVIFSDANAMYAGDAIRKLVRNFADPKVGAVVGESTYAPAEVESERSESLYWKYETAIKRLETQTGSVVGGDGAIYAIRRSLYAPMRADALSDFVNPLQIVKQGFLCAYEPDARSYEKAADDFDKEFRRKVRIVNRAWRATFSMPEILNPLRYGGFALRLFSHKLLRWLVPAFLLALLVLSALLAPASRFYLVMLVAQLVFYALALGGYAMRDRAKMPPWISIPFYFCMVNYASGRGIVEAHLGKTYTTWTTARAGQ